MTYRTSDNEQSKSTCLNMSRHVGEIVIVLGVVLLVLLRWGYAFGLADQWVLGIKGIKMAHPDLFAQDWVANTLVQPHWLFEYFTYAAEVHNVLPEAYLIYWAISTVLVGVGILRLSRWLGWSKVELPLAAIMLMVMGPLSVAGSTTALVGYALPHAAGAGIILLAISFLVQGRVLIVALLTFSAVLVHLQHGANLAVIILFATIVDSHLSRPSRLALAVTSLFSLGLVSGIAEWRGLAQSGEDFVRICTEYITFHCYAPAWPLTDFLSLPFLVFSPAALLFRYREKLRSLAAPVLLPVCVLTIGILADYFDIPLVAWLARRFNVYRWVTIVVPFACLGFVSFLRSAPTLWLYVIGVPVLACWLVSASALLSAAPLTGLVSSVLLVTQAVLIRRLASGSSSSTYSRRMLAYPLLSGVILLNFGQERVAIRQLVEQNKLLGVEVAQHVPEDGLILCPPTLHALRFTSRRSIVIDSKAVPHGGSSLFEWEQRINDLGGYDWDGGKFYTLSFEALLKAVDRYHPTHVLLECLDSKNQQAAERWGPGAGIDLRSACYELYALPFVRSP